VMKPSRISREESSFVWAQPSHDAEVDRDQASLGVDEQIARVHVGMKKAITKRVAQEGLDQGAAEPREIQVPCRQRRAVAERRAVDPFHRQHIAGRIVPFHQRHAEIRIVLGVLRHLGKRGCLKPQVHLKRDRTAKGFDHSDELQPPRFCRPEFGTSGHEPESLKVDLEAPLDSGAQHFDRDRSPSRWRFDFSAMHLGDGGGRNRRPERYEHVRELPAQCRRNGFFSLGLRKRRHPVLEAS